MELRRTRIQVKSSLTPHTQGAQGLQGQDNETKFAVLLAPLTTVDLDQNKATILDDNLQLVQR